MLVEGKAIHLAEVAGFTDSHNYIAAPPDVLRVDEKNTREYAVVNAIGLLITTNYKSDGIFLPPDDRRHFVAWTDVVKELFAEDYWRDFWAWLQASGIGAVSAFLRGLDISNFDPKAPPQKPKRSTPSFAANANPEVKRTCRLSRRDRRAAGHHVAAISGQRPRKSGPTNHSSRPRETAAVAASAGAGRLRHCPQSTP